ncbi:MAG: dimethyl sulfoxide reductase anchor subunit [Alphaproteobacteria bacterium]|nr:dimethyl sulfoxide reductase anchor subunit [Alphaproteobacteria bacterium]
MHPALSIILFTTLSGTGYGLLFWLGLLAPLWILPIGAYTGVGGVALAILFITAGLLCSSLHLGHPERAWRALTQWRSSWLSREGIASFVTYVPALSYGYLWFGGGGDRLWSLAGYASAAGAVVTIVCTAMIYRSLKTVRRWHNGWVTPNYLALAAASGATWVVAVMAMRDEFSTPQTAVGAAVVTALAAGLKIGYWRFIDQHHSGSTIASATGLGRLGLVRLLDPPHTEDNYLLKEMGFQIGRQHATKLRRIALGTGFAAPIVLLLLAALTAGIVAAASALAAAFVMTVGVLVERWLFFAEAKHTVTLYYGATAA